MNISATMKHLTLPTARRTAPGTPGRRPFPLDAGARPGTGSQGAGKAPRAPRPPGASWTATESGTGDPVRAGAGPRAAGGLPASRESTAGRGPRWAVLCLVLAPPRPAWGPPGGPRCRRDGGVSSLSGRGAPCTPPGVTRPLVSLVNVARGAGCPSVRRPADRGQGGLVRAPWGQRREAGPRVSGPDRPWGRQGSPRLCAWAQAPSSARPGSEPGRGPGP